MSEFELNDGYGIGLFNGNSARIEHSDVARNKGYGLYATGSSRKQGTKYLVIVGNQFGNGANTDIYIDGWDGEGHVSVANLITGNMFYSGIERTADTTDAIFVSDSFANTISGNVFNSNRDHEYRHAVNFHTTGHAIYDTVTGNSFIGEFSVKPLNPGTYTSTVGNTEGGNFLYRDLAVSGSIPWRFK